MYAILMLSRRLFKSVCMQVSMHWQLTKRRGRVGLVFQFPERGTSWEQTSDRWAA